MASKKILCPYCFEEFENTQAYYQCESEERDRNGEYACPRVTDAEYDRYWKGEDLLMRYIWPQKVGLGARLFGPKFDAKKCPQCGYNSRRFVCPHCLNWLPTEMIENGAEIISVIGSPSSGKTNYIVSLIHQLRKYGYRMDLQVAPTQIYRDGHKDESTQNLYKKLDEELFRNKTVLKKTAVNKAEIPWIFHLSQQSTGKHIYLVFYDTAGEKFKEDLKNKVKYLKESSGVIVLLDVLTVGEIKRILRNEGFDEFAGGPVKASFQEIQDALFNFDDPNLKNKPFAFVFSKFDAVIDHTDKLNFNADEFQIGDKRIDSGYLKTGVVDMSKINTISHVIEDTLEDEWDEGDFAHFCQGWGSKKNLSLPRTQRNPEDPDNNYKFFGVSAFGTMPDNNNMMDKVEPYRVMDPLVWMLHKLGQFKIPVK